MTQVLIVEWWAVRQKSEIHHEDSIYRICRLPEENCVVPSDDEFLVKRAVFASSLKYKNKAFKKTVIERQD